MKFSLDTSFCAVLVACLGHFPWQATLVGSIFLIAMVTDRAAADPPPAEPTAQTQVESLDSLQAKPGEIVGVVVDSNGDPIEGALVDAWTWWTGTEMRTDAKGQFALNPKNDDRERAEVRISKPGYSPHYIVQQAVGVKPIRIELNDTTYIEGKVTDAAGNPIASVTVRGEQGPKQGDGVMITGVTTETTTDEDGRYRMYVYPDTYELKVTVPEQGVARLSDITVAEGQAKSLDIKLSEGVDFQAHVVDAVTGKPVEGLVLWSWREKSVFGKSDSDGKLSIEGMLPGTFEFGVGGGKPFKRGSIEGYQHGPFGRWWSPEAVNEWERKQIEPGQFQRNFDGLKFDLSVGMEPVTIEVERGVVFTGKVFDPAGNPVEKATVAPAKTGSGNSLTGDTRYSARTKEDGSYRVVMPAGNDFQYNLIAHDGTFREWRNWANAVTEPLTTKPGDKVSIDITLNAPCTVKGQVKADGDRNVAGLKVRSHAADLRGNRYYDPTTGKTDSEGRFELDFIRPGKHYIQVEPFYLTASQAPGKSTVLVELAEGETKEGIELQVASNNIPAAPAMLARTFVVNVVDENEKPIEGVSVFAFTAMKPSSLELFGDRDGFADRMQSITEDPNRHVSNEKGQITIEGSELFGNRPMPASLVAIDTAGNRGAMETLYPDAKGETKTLKLAPLCDVSITLSTDKLVGGTDIGEQIAGVLYLTKNSSLIAMIQPKKITQTMSIQLPPGEYELMTYIASSNPAKHAITVPEQESHTLEPIELEPSRLSLLFGKPAPALREIADWHGENPGTLESLHGKVVILDFWGYWCGPCVAAMPELMALHDQYHEQGLTIIGIHDASVSSAEQLMEQTKTARDGAWQGRSLPFPTAIAGGGTVPIEGTEVMVNGQVIADYGINAFPTTLLIDQQGILVGELGTQDPAAAKKRIEDLLATPAPQLQ